MVSVDELQERYGRHDYGLLTALQRSFLKHPDIRDDKDGGGFNTVSVKDIRTHEGASLLEVEDVLSYLFRRSVEGVYGSAHQRGYALSRIPGYKRALGLEADPVLERLDNQEVWVFGLRDGSKILARFSTIKHKT